jgi:hypothetical protein
MVLIGSLVLTLGEDVSPEDVHDAGQPG